EKSDRDKLAQTSTRPIQILCHTKDTSSSKYDDLFDIVIHPEGERLRVEMKPDLKDLPSWYDSLNHKQDPRYEHIVKP
ncbi:hypothetical protein, partial [Paenibacillus riograndensis]